MSFVKKSFNMHPDLAQRLDDFMAANPGLSLTLIMQRALSRFLDNPEIKPPTEKISEEELEEFLNENSDLMDELAE
jgi:hypothetical protein